jgi:pimeloyl-ACP methyl ester carboxylesterase
LVRSHNFFVLIFTLRGQRKVYAQLKSFDSKYLTIGNHKIHYKQVGQGPHLILIHGLGASTYAWRFVVPKLSESYTVTILDLLGFGLSDKPKKFSYNLDDQSKILIQFINQLQIDKAKLVGSSMGGALALWICKLYPERFTDAVTIAPAIDPSVALLDFHNISFLSTLVLPAVTPAFVRSIMMRVISKKELINEESVNNYYTPYAKGSSAIKAFVLSFSLLRDKRFPNELKYLTTRHLMIWGANDKIVPFSVGEKLQKILPHTEFVILENGSHHLMEDSPDWLVEQILKFFS